MLNLTQCFEPDYILLTIFQIKVKLTSLGLNRRLNDVTNTIAAAEFALSKMSNLYAIELGNEPNC
jgi:hypothetical protein